MKSLLSEQADTQTASDTKSDSVWQKTACANLYRYKPSGTYFAHIKIRGKLIRRSLKTKLQSVAKMRLGDLEKSERQTADSATAVAGGKMTFGDALAVFRVRLQGGQTKAKKPRSKAYREERSTALLKSWPTLEKSTSEPMESAEAWRPARSFTGICP